MKSSFGELCLVKPGDALLSSFALNLSKPSRFKVELAWTSNHDLDAHAIMCKNTGNGPKVTDMRHVLSTYNAKCTNPKGRLEVNADGSFATPEGALTHSGDCRDGVPAGVSESISIDGSKLPASVNEIGIFVTIHNAKHLTFSKVAAASITIKDDSGETLAGFRLTDQFGPFTSVQMGSLILINDNWEFTPAGCGFLGDFNQILSFLA